jgi:hypothetical protein
MWLIERRNYYRPAGDQPLDVDATGGAEAVDGGAASLRALSRGEHHDTGGNLAGAFAPRAAHSNGRVNGTLQPGCSGNLSAALVLTPSVQMPFSAAAV